MTVDVMKASTTKEKWNQFLELIEEKIVVVLFHVESDAFADAVKEKFNEIADKTEDVAFAQVDVENGDYYENPDDRDGMTTVVFYVKGEKVTVENYLRP